MAYNIGWLSKCIFEEELRVCVVIELPIRSVGLIGKLASVSRHGFSEVAGCIQVKTLVICIWDWEVGKGDIFQRVLGLSETLFRYESCCVSADGSTVPC